MIQHIVLIKCKGATMEEDTVAAFEAARALFDEIEWFQSLTLGRNRAEADHGFTHALIVNLADEDALGSYLAHPTPDALCPGATAAARGAAHRARHPGRHDPQRAPTVRDWVWGASVGIGLCWMTERVPPLQALAASGA